jgi:hypothetical protein
MGFLVWKQTIWHPWSLDPPRLSFSWSDMSTQQWPFFPANAFPKCHRLYQHLTDLKCHRK